MPAAALAVRVSAQIAEFQKAFADAQRTTRGFEKDFAGMASSVQAHQDRLNRTFAQFAGDKIIGDANALVTAITKVGGAAKLTDSEMRSVNATLTEAIAKYQRLGQTAPASMVALEQATRKVEAAAAPMARTTSIFGQSIETLGQKSTLSSKAMDALTGTFGKFTLAGIAVNLIGKLTGAMAQFIDQGTKLGPVEASFEKLAGSVRQQSGALLNSMQTATRGLVSNYDLMLSANKAVLLGLPVTAEGMSDLAKTATALGKAMGLDATQSLNDLITALGRSSPLILDNLGLTVSVAEANEKYAASIGKTAEQLTDAEQKIAFHTEAMAKARAKVQELGVQELTLGEQMSRVWIEIENVVVKTVSAVNTEVGKMISDTERAVRDSISLFNRLRTQGLRGTIAGFATGPMAAAVTAAGTPPVAPIVATAPDQVAALRRITAEVNALTAAQRGQLSAGKDLGLTNEKLVEAFKKLFPNVKLTEQHLKVLEDQTRQTTKATNEAETVEKKIFAILRETSRMWFENEQALRKQFLALQAATVANRKYVEFLPQIIEQTTTWAERQKLLTDRLKLGAQILGGEWAKAQDKTREMLAKSAEFFARQQKAVNDTITGLVKLGQAAGGQIGVWTSFGGGVVDTFRTMSQAVKDFSKLTDATFKDTAAMAVGWMLAVVQIGQTAMDFLNRNMITSQRRDFLTQQGGLPKFQTRATTAGVDTSILLGTDSLESFNRQMERVNRRIEESEARLDRYGLTWRDLSQEIRQANIDQITRDLLKDWKALGLQGADATKAMAGGLSQLVIDAKKTGTKIPAALAPMLRTLIESKQLSEDAARALLGMAEDATPAFKDVEDAAHRYGIELDALGPKVAQLRITDVARQLVKDFDLFQKSGADMNQVLLGMQKSVQDVVTEALTLGLEIPESMRPLLEAMAKAGLLTDETGTKMTDLSRLNFAKPITDAIEALILKLDELIDKWSKVGTAADDAGERQRRANEKTGEAVPRGTTPPAGTTPPEPSAPGDSTGTRSLTVNTYLDGRTIAQRTVPYLPDVLDVHGV